MLLGIEEVVNKQAHLLLRSSLVIKEERRTRYQEEHGDA
jgi:hypothetical protein